MTLRTVLRLTPLLSGTATTLRLTGRLWTPGWQMTQVAEILALANDGPVRVMLPDLAPPHWQDAWVDALGALEPKGLEVQFVPAPRKRRLPF